MTWLAGEFGVSRKTVHKRIERYRESGWDGLGDRSRAPHRHPNRTAEEVSDLVVAAKRSHMTWGPKKVVAWLGARRPDLVLPAPSTAGELLGRAGLVRPRKRRQGSAPWGEPFRSVCAPNDTWTIDLKGWFRTGDGARCDPLTVEDAYSRCCLCLKGLETPTHLEVRRELEKAFREYGLPLSMRSDNGPPFASTGLGGLTRLSAWWVKLGIVPERIEPARPDQNGRHERMHRTVKQETACPPEGNKQRQQRSFDRFLKEYNSERPHEAIGQRTPFSLYQPSPRKYPQRVKEPEYPGSLTRVRRVRSNGEIKWNGDLIFLSEALRGEPVGLVPKDDHQWAILFGPLEIGALDERSRKVLRTPVKLLPMCPV